MEYLIQQNQVNAGDSLPVEQITAKDKRVVIIGGGDTGSDCLGTAHRQGCQDVHQFELLPEPPPQRAESTPWPLWPMQLRTSHAHEEGCDRQWSVSTTKFSGGNGQVSTLHAHQVSFDGGKFIPVPGTEFEMGVDLVLLAMASPARQKRTARQPGCGVRRSWKRGGGPEFHDRQRGHLCRRRYQTRCLAHCLGHCRGPQSRYRCRCLPQSREQLVCCVPLAFLISSSASVGYFRINASYCHPRLDRGSRVFAFSFVREEAGRHAGRPLRRQGQALWRLPSSPQGGRDSG